MYRRDGDKLTENWIFINFYFIGKFYETGYLQIYKEYFDKY